MNICILKSNACISTMMYVSTNKHCAFKLQQQRSLLGAAILVLTAFLSGVCLRGGIFGQEGDRLEGLSGRDEM